MLSRMSSLVYLTLTSLLFLTSITIAAPASTNTTTLSFNPSKTLCNSTIDTISNISSLTATRYIPVPSSNPPLRLAIDEFAPRQSSPSILQLLVTALSSKYVAGRPLSAQFSPAGQKARVLYDNIPLQFYGRLGELLSVGQMVQSMAALGDYIAREREFGNNKRVRIEQTGLALSYPGLIFMGIAGPFACEGAGTEGDGDGGDWTPATS